MERDGEAEGGWGLRLASWNLIIANGRIDGRVSWGEGAIGYEYFTFRGISAKSRSRARAEVNVDENRMLMTNIFIVFRRYPHFHRSVENSLGSRIPFHFLK